MVIPSSKPLLLRSRSFSERDWYFALFPSLPDVVPLALGFSKVVAEVPGIDEVVLVTTNNCRKALSISTSHMDKGSLHLNYSVS